MIVGIVLLPIVLIAWFVRSIVAAVRASNGEYYEYPFTIRFVSGDRLVGFAIGCCAGPRQIDGVRTIRE